LRSKGKTTKETTIPDAPCMTLTYLGRHAQEGKITMEGEVSGGRGMRKETEEDQNKHATIWGQYDGGNKIKRLVMARRVASHTSRLVYQGGILLASNWRQCLESRTRPWKTRAPDRHVKINK
jgi:hypothetical protein